MGRPSKKTAAAREAILRGVRVGLSLRDSANLGNLSYETLNEWRKADPDFASALESARSELAVNMLERIEAAAADPRHWTAAAWYLERAYPQEFGRRQVRVEMSGSDGGPIAVDNAVLDKMLENLSFEQLRELAGQPNCGETDDAAVTGSGRRLTAVS